MRNIQQQPAAWKHLTETKLHNHVGFVNKTTCAISKSSYTVHPQPQNQ